MRTALMTAVLAAAQAPALAHLAAGGDHLKIGYYNGHDETFEAPADPAWPDTLLIDTHPWELIGEEWILEPATDNPFLGDGWVGTNPGFEPLLDEEQEFGGHGYFTVLGTGVNPVIELVSLEPGLQILRPDLTDYLPGDQIALGTGIFNVHPTYFVSEESDGRAVREAGDRVRAVFKIVDLNGTMEESEPFTVTLALGPICVPDLDPVGDPDGQLGFFDLVAYLTLFADQDPDADLDPPGGDGVFGFFDLVAYLTLFAAGCP